MLVSASAAAALFSTSFLLPIVRKSDANNETVQIIQVEIYSLVILQMIGCMYVQAIFVRIKEHVSYIMLKKESLKRKEKKHGNKYM